jgi:HEAT repeat protein
LQVLLGNDDVMTRINAAIALSRSGSIDGLAVLKQALTEKASATPDGQAEHFLILKNSLKALADLAPMMTLEDKVEFRELVQTLIRTHAEPRIRIDAQNALNALK